MLVMIYGLTCRTHRNLRKWSTRRASANQPVKCVQKIPSFVSTRPTDTMPLQIWENAPITLETTNPTFGLDIPVLPAWNLNLGYPVQVRSKSIGGMGGVKRHRKILPDEDDLDYVEHQVAQITSTGSVNATFRIPGRTTIPSDDDEHSVTIADLKLDAKVTWVCIPKADTRVHLEVSSEFNYCLQFSQFRVFIHRPTSRILRIMLSSPASATYTSIEASSHDQISQMSVRKPCSTVLLGKFVFEAAVYPRIY